MSSGYRYIQRLVNIHNLPYSPKSLRTKCGSGPGHALRRGSRRRLLGRTSRLYELTSVCVTAQSTNLLTADEQARLRKLDEELLLQRLFILVTPDKRRVVLEIDLHPDEHARAGGHKAEVLAASEHSLLIHRPEDLLGGCQHLTACPRPSGMTG
jgi:hypothetical protein